MKILLARGIYALLLADILSVAARPVSTTTSRLVPRESFGVEFPSTDSVNHHQIVSSVVDSNDGQDIVARTTSDGDGEPHAGPSASRMNAEQPRRDRMAIPHEFFPQDSPPVEMILPTARNLSGWGSVLNIFNLISAIANLDGKLTTSRDTIKTQLDEILPFSSVNRYSRELKKTRPTALVLENTKNLDLDELRDSIQKAVQLHNDFEGEVMVPKGFLVGPTTLAIKVPYKNGKEEAVASLGNILKLIRLATVNNETL
ncbi:hypothetical protein H0H93_005060, partial [Arthromyces matolae]